MKHPGYQLTEWAYTHPWLRPEAKLVLGVTLQWPERNPSIRQLADVLPINERAVIEAQAELELEGIARYQRPTKRRGGTDPRYTESNRLAWVHPKAEPNRRRQDAERGAFLPPAVAEQLPRGVRGKKNAKMFPLVALVYAHEQARSGRVAIQDDAVGALVGLTARQVRVIRQQLIAAEVIERAAYVPRLGKSYRLVGTPAPDVQFDAGKVKRTHDLHGALPNPNASVLIVASKYEMGYLRTLLDQLSPEARADVVVDAQANEGGAGEAFGIAAAALIAASKLRLEESGSEASNDRSSQHQMTVLANVSLVPSSRPSSTNNPIRSVRQNLNKTRTSAAAPRRTQGRKERKVSAHQARMAPAMRDVIAEKNLRLRADDEVWATILKVRDGLTEKYGLGEWEEFAREWVLASAGSGKTFLKLAYARFHWLKPRQPDTAAKANRRAEIALLLAPMTPAADEADIWPDE